MKEPRPHRKAKQSWRSRTRRNLDAEDRQKVQVAAGLLSTMETAMRFLGRLLIFALGDPHWKSRTRIDWRKVIFFRRRLTHAEGTALFRRGEQVLDAEHGDNVEEKVKREVMKDTSS